MSGRKYSRTRLNQALRQKRQSLHQVDRHLREIEGVRKQIKQAVTEATQGVKDFFATDAAKAEQWIALVDALKYLPGVSLSSSSSDLSARIDKLQSLATQGFTLENRVQDAFINKAGALRTEGTKQIFEAESLLNRGEKLIELWFGAKEVDNFRARLRQLREDQKRDRLEQVAQLSKSLNSDLARKLKVAEVNETKHQSRLYILKALRQVAVDMGFKEIGSPHFTTPGDRGSRIVLKVDTINRGVVTFYLSLKGIEADSCISETHCFEEFNELSTRLNETFGVVTKFKMEEDSTPQLRRRGELEEPTGKGMEAD